MTHEIDTRLRALERAVVCLLRDVRATEEKDQSTLYSAVTWGERLDAVYAAVLPRSLDHDPTPAPTEPTPAARGEVANG
jgi:hypothetical protein